MTGFEHLIGKPAPAFILPNFDGEPFEYKPGASGLPTALLFYPQSGQQKLLKASVGALFVCV
jgi:peroxiredoxin Q/BCP